MFSWLNFVDIWIVKLDLKTNEQVNDHYEGEYTYFLNSLSMHRDLVVVAWCRQLKYFLNINQPSLVKSWHSLDLSKRLTHLIFTFQLYVGGLECCRLLVFFTKWCPYTGKVTSPRILVTVLISMVTPYEVRLRWVEAQRKEGEEKDTR